MSIRLVEVEVEVESWVVRPYDDTTNGRNAHKLQLRFYPEKRFRRVVPRFDVFLKLLVP